VGLLAVGDWDERESDSIVSGHGGLHAVLGAAHLTANNPGVGKRSRAIGRYGGKRETPSASAPQARILVSIFIIVL
jgi:hypothetical protein